MGLFDDFAGGNPPQATAPTPTSQAAPAPVTPTADATVVPRPSQSLFDDFARGTQPLPAARIPERGAAQPKIGYAQPYGQLKAADPDWTQWAKWKAQDALAGVGFKTPHAQHFGDALVNVGNTLVAPMGTVLSGANAIYHGKRGNYGSTAIESLGAIPFATMYNRFRHGMPTKSLAEVPSEDALRASKNTKYEDVANAPVTYTPNAMPDAANQIAFDLRRRFNPLTAPSTFENLKEAPKIIGQRGATRPSDFDAFRQILRQPGVPMSSDKAASKEAIKLLDDWMANTPPHAIAQAPPGAIDQMRRDLAHARGDYAALQRSKAVTGRMDTAEIKAETTHSGKNFDNTLRQHLANLQTTKAGQRETAGFIPTEMEDLRAVSGGDWLTNKARDYSKEWGGGGGLARMLARTSATGFVGTGAHMLGMDPMTTAALAGGAAFVPGAVGGAARQFAEDRTRRAAELLGETMRKRSPTYQANVALENARGGPPIDPFALQRDAIAYALTPQVQQQLRDAKDAAYTPYENR